MSAEATPATGAPAPAPGKSRGPAAPRLTVVDYLRGVAILLVCFCHFSHSLPEVTRSAAVEIGKTGVQIFFCISGFIIPYGLARSGYRLRSVHRFYAKRLLRLQPPYLVALGLFFLISAAAARAKHGPTDWNFVNVLQASVYQWIPPENPVYWTLIVELKYYFFISLAFPLFFGPRWLAVPLLVLSAACVHWFHGYDRLLMYATFFLFGFVACRKILGQAGNVETALLLLAVLVGGIGASTPLELGVGLATALVILWMPAFESRVLGYFGALSYSLYLIHFPVGVKVINLLDDRVPPPFKIFLGALALGLSIGVAELIFHLAEKPAILWSQAIKLSDKSRLKN